MSNKESQKIPEKMFAEFNYPNYEDWKEAAVKLLKGKPFDKVLFTKTYEGITLKPIYHQEDIETISHIGSLPGFPPYVRGTEAEGNLKRPWEISQELKISTPEELNQTILSDIEKGQTMLNIVLDQSTRLGIDPDRTDDLLIGKNGVSISTLDDIKNMFNEIDLDKYPFFITAGVTSLPLVALLAAYLKDSDKSFANLQGCIGTDPISELAKNGSVSIDIEKALDTEANLLIWAEENAPKLKTILIQGNLYHDAGADAVQELAYAVATGVEYIRALQKRGLTIDQIAPKICFSFALGSNFFMEIAKIRAARLIWSQIIETFGGDEQSQKIYIHGTTSSWTKTMYDPYVNMLRNTSEAFSGAVAGVDSMHVTPFDEPIREADDFSRRISRNLQSILQEECHLNQPIDPAGGSWYVESLTQELAERSWKLFQKIEAKAGILSALEKGTIQEALAAKAEEKLMNTAIRKHIFVGTNMYPNLQEKPLEQQNIDYAAIKKARALDVQTYRKKNDHFELPEKINNEFFAKTIEAVLSGATLGDIFDSLRNNDNNSLTIEPIKIQRGAEKYEELRKNAERIKREKGSMFKVFLTNMGPLKQHKARADFTTGFFKVGGFEVIQNDGFSTIDEAVDATLASEAPITVICSTDDTYPELVPPIAEKLKAAKPELKVIVAGKPAKDLESVYRDAGVDEFIHVRANCLELLSNLQKEAQ